MSLTKDSHENSPTNIKSDLIYNMIRVRKYSQYSKLLQVRLIRGLADPRPNGRIVGQVGNWRKKGGFLTARQSAGTSIQRHQLVNTFHQSLVTAKHVWESLLCLLSDLGKGQLTVDSL